MVVRGKENTKNKQKTSQPSGVVSAPNACLWVVININNVVCLGLIDTGSPVCLISLDLFRRLESVGQPIHTLKISNCRIKGVVPTKKIQVNVQCFLDFSIEGIKFYNNFLVTPFLSYDCILGVNWCEKYEITLTFSKENFIKINDTYIAFLKNKEGTSIELACLDYKKESKGNFSRNLLDKNNISITKGEENIFYQLIENFETIFKEKPGTINNFEQHIEFEEALFRPPYKYQIPHILKDSVQELINNMIKDDIIEESNSHFLSPMRIVNKKDGSLRLCLDCRAINKCIKNLGDMPQPPQIILADCQQGTFISSLDINAAYWHILLTPPSRKYVAFQFRNKTYQFKRLPFGLNISMSVFTRAMHNILQGKFSNSIFVYVDDILIISNSFEEHLEHLKFLFEKFKKFGVTINLSKSKFISKEVSFLGFVVSGSGIKPNREKLEVIYNWPIPSNKKDLKSFLGFISFYRHFIPQHANKTENLRKLIKGDQKWRWDDSCQRTFENMKREFLQYVPLYFPDYNKPFYIYTDGSKHGVGAVITQITNNNERPVAFVSRTLQHYEMNISVTELELLSIFVTLKKYQYMLLGYNIIIKSDHKPLSLILSNKVPFNDKIARWLSFINQFCIEFVYIPGKENKIADLLSRNTFRYKELDNEIIIAVQCPFAYDNDLVIKLKSIEQEQLRDTFCNYVKSNMEKYKKHFQIYNHLLFTVEDKISPRIVIPKNIAYSVVRAKHVENGHYGIDKTYKMICSDIYIKNLKSIVKNITKSCDLCQRVKYIQQYKIEKITHTQAKYRGHIISTDLYGPLPTSRGGVKYLAVYLDCFTKYVQIYPTKSISALTIANTLERYIKEVQKPEIVLTDPGTQYTSKKWLEKLQLHDIEHMFTAIRSPPHNPVERINKEIGRLLRTYIKEKHTIWANLIPQIQLLINSIPHKVTGFPPILLQLGRYPKSIIRELIVFPPLAAPPLAYLHSIALKRIEKSQEKYDKNKGNQSYQQPYKVGDLVLLKDNRSSSTLDATIYKFFNIYCGPFTIKLAYGDGNYELEGEKKKKIGKFNTYLLKPYIQSFEHLPIKDN